MSDYQSFGLLPDTWTLITTCLACGLGMSESTIFTEGPLLTIASFILI